jgi:hypothetical protein
MFAGPPKFGLPGQDRQADLNAAKFFMLRKKLGSSFTAFALGYFLNRLQS